MKNPNAVALVEYLSSLDFVCLENEYVIPESHKNEARESEAEYKRINVGDSVDETIHAIKNK